MLSLALVPLVAVCAPPPSQLRSWSGSGVERLAPITLKRDARLVYQAKGEDLAVVNSSGDQRTDTLIVNATKPRGSTYLPAGRYALRVESIGAWRIEVVR